MTQPIEELVRAASAAFGRGDLSTLPDQHFDEDIVWHVVGMGLAGDYEGAEQVLALLAMLNVQDHQQADAVLVNADDQVLDGLLARERAFWLGSARSLGLTGPEGVDSVVAAQAVAVACLIGVADEGAAVRTLARVPGMADASAGSRRKIARWIQQIYPPELSRPAGPEPSWWGSLVPTCWLSGTSLSLPPRPTWPQGACEA